MRHRDMIMHYIGLAKTTQDAGHKQHIAGPFFKDFIRGVGRGDVGGQDRPFSHFQPTWSHPNSDPGSGPEGPVGGPGGPEGDSGGLSRFFIRK